jgi:hypothetical protein
MLYNSVLRKIYRSTRAKITGQWRRLHNEELHDLYFSFNLIWVIISSRVRCGGHVACMKAKRHAQRILVGRHEGNSVSGRPRHKCDDNIKKDLQEAGLI